MKKNRWVFLVFLGYFGVVFPGMSGKPFTLSETNRAALTDRLKSLEGRKAELESQPNSLDKQRRYQKRIDLIKMKLGQPLMPFSVDYSDKKLGEKTRFLPEKEEEIPSLSSRARSGNVDFFHNSSQVMNTKRSIEEHDGINPRSSLLSTLPPPRNRSVSQPPKGGVLIDGEASMMSLPPMGETLKKMDLNSAPLYTKKRAPLEEKKEKSLRSKETGGFSLDHHGPRPTSVWEAGNAAAAQDQQKIGWSMPAPMISAPLFSQPQVPRMTEGYPSQRRFLQTGVALQPSHKCSFSPHKLVGVWQGQ